MGSACKRLAAQEVNYESLVYVWGCFKVLDSPRLNAEKHLRISTGGPVLQVQIRMSFHLRPQVPLVFAAPGKWVKPPQKVATHCPIMRYSEYLYMRSLALPLDADLELEDVCTNVQVRFQNAATRDFGVAGQLSAALTSQCLEAHTWLHLAAGSQASAP